MEAFAAILTACLAGSVHDFFAAKAWVESRGRTEARNDDDGGPARRAARRLLADGRIADCGLDLDSYAFSGGLFGQIPAIAAASMPEAKSECAEPVRVHEPAWALRAAVEYAARLQRWPSYRAEPTWETLWLGFRAPALMAHPDHPKARIALQNMKRGLRATGGTLKGRPPSFGSSR